MPDEISAALLAKTSVSRALSASIRSTITPPSNFLNCAANHSPLPVASDSFPPDAAQYRRGG
jgi:hypothetical protein